MKTRTSTQSASARRGRLRAFGIATIAGTPYDPSGDGGPATVAAFNLSGVAFRAGNVYLTDGSRIRKIAENGIITTVAGLLDPVVHQPTPGFSGDGGPALGAQIRGAAALEFDSAGNLYIADSGNNCVRKITARVAAGLPLPLDGTETIATIAGVGAALGNSGDGGPATSARLSSPRGIAIDAASGTIYIVDQNNNNVRKVDPTGLVTTIGGTGTAGFSGDGAPATTAMFNLPTGVTTDPESGDVYVADVLNSRIRKITMSTGIVTTFAGTGISSASGNLNEGGPAIAANIRPVKVRLINGILYMVDSGVGKIRMINIATGIITTLAGTGAPPYSGAFPPVGDGGPATGGLLGSGPGGVQDAAFDEFQNLFITDAGSHRVRFVANAAVSATIFGQTVAPGNIATVAGPQGIVTFSGEGGAAIAARLFQGGSMAFDTDGNLYISDGGNNRVRRVDAARVITTIAGNGTVGFPSAPGPATAAQLQPGGLAFHADNLYLTNNSVRIAEISSGVIRLIANSNGASTPASADGTAAIDARMGATSVAFDTAGNLYVSDNLNNRIWKIDTSGNVHTVAGGGTGVIDGVTVTATQARLFGPGSLVFDGDGNLYTVDGAKNRILKIMPHTANVPLDGTEIITIFAGTGQPGFSGDGGPAAAALLNGPGGLVFDKAGSLYFSDGANFRIRKTDTTGTITTVAGTGVASFKGDGGPAASAQIRGGPLVFDSFGNLYMADGANNVVRVLDNTPPMVTFGTPVPAPNANGWHNTSVSIPFTVSDTGAGVASINPASPLIVAEEGEAVSDVVAAKDRAGNKARVSSPAVKIDKEGPLISGLPMTNLVLWPPDGRMVHVGTVTAVDGLSGVAEGSFHVTAISNEPYDPHEISITPDGSGGWVIALRAHHLEHGHGRTYTITGKASDNAGNTSSVTATCTVPRHHSG